MRKPVERLVSIFVILAASVACASADMVKSLDFTAVTRTEKVVIDIDGDQQTMEYLTPSRDYKYVILDYDYTGDPNTGSSVFRGTVLDTKFNTASEVIIYSNDKFSNMRIGKRQITFTYVQEFDVKK